MQFYSVKTLKIVIIAFLLNFTASIISKNFLTLDGVQAQTTEVNETAEKLFREGMALYQEGTAESLQQASIKLEQALPLYQQAGDILHEATINLALGRFRDLLGFKQEALTYYNQALPLYKLLKDYEQEAITLNNIGLVYDGLGEKQQALDYYNQALPLKQAVGDRGSEAVTLNNIGRIYDDLGKKQQALNFFNQALPLLRAVGDRRGEAVTLNNIGSVYDNLGEKQQAFDYYNQVLPLLRAVGDRRGEATTLNNIGRVYDDLGEKQQALDFFDQALSLYRAVGDRSGEAKIFGNIGLVYDDLGEKQQALDYYNQALPIFRAVGDRAQEATILSGIGKVYDDLGEQQQALDYYHQALPLSRVVGDRAQEASTLSNIGVIYSDQGEKRQALDFYNQALSLLRAVGDRRGEATTLNNLGVVYSDLGEKQQALDYYNQALPLSRAVGDRSGEALTLSNIAYIEKNRGNLQAALSPMQKSIAIIEDLRTKINSKELRQTYFSTVQDYYQIYIDLLMELHQQNPSQSYNKEAFNISEKSRARTLLELLTEAKINIKEGINPKLKEQEQTLSQKLDQTEQQRLLIYQNNDSTDAEQAEINQDLDQLTQKFQQLQEEIRRSSPKYADFKYPQPITTEQVQNKILDDDTVLLQYALGTEKSYLWVITKNSFNSYILPKNSELIELINNVRNQITDASKENAQPPIKQKFTQERIAAIQQLSQKILQPAASLLNKKRILVVPDGALYTLPFSVLSASNDSYQPLAIYHEIINLPSSSTLNILRQNNRAKIPNNPSLAIFADPVFATNDCRLTNTSNCDQERLLASKHRAARELNYVTWDDLPGTYTEAKNILNLFPAKTNTESAFGFAATRDRVIGNQLENYDLIHFATHGFFNEKKPDQSGLVFSLVDEKGQSQNGFLRLDSIFNMKLNADLVVMSACQTGLGEEIKGEGMVGLSRGFMYAGASNLLMSLWSVDDAATAEFMTRFYRLLLNEKFTPAAALQETQRQMREETKWSHPYYWSAFILQGDWH